MTDPLVHHRPSRSAQPSGCCGVLPSASSRGAAVTRAASRARSPPHCKALFILGACVMPRPSGPAPTRADPPRQSNGHDRDRPSWPPFACPTSLPLYWRASQPRPAPGKGGRAHACARWCTCQKGDTAHDHQHHHQPGPVTGRGRVSLRRMRTSAGRRRAVPPLPVLQPVRLVPAPHPRRWGHRLYVLPLVLQQLSGVVQCRGSMPVPRLRPVPSADRGRR